MTETECMDCDFALECDEDLIIWNLCSGATRCEEKRWRLGFNGATEAVRAHIVTVGEFYDHSIEEKDLM